MNRRHGTEVEMVSEREVELLLAKLRHYGIVIDHV